MEIALVLLAGLALGTAVGWFFRSRAMGPDLALARQRTEQAEKQLDETRQQAAQIQRQRDAAIEQLREESSRRASFEALAAGIPDLQREVEARSMSILQHQRTLLGTHGKQPIHRLDIAMRGDLDPLLAVLRGRRLSARRRMVRELRAERATRLLADWGALLEELVARATGDRPDATVPICELAASCAAAGSWSVLMRRPPRARRG